jgi:predicted enzyme related to lactoylglutathione lyase
MHEVCHTEFAADDPAALAEFYRQVFGWKLMPMGSDYILWSASEDPQAAGGGFRRFYPDENRGPSGRTVVYLHVADIPATLEQIDAHGGSRMIDKTAIEGDHGYYACFGDPAGNTVGLWSKE